LRFSSNSFLSISPFREALFENVESRAAVTISAARTDAIEPACTEISTTGRHDPCVGIRATPVGEAMVACVMHAREDGVHHPPHFGHRLRAARLRVEEIALEAKALREYIQTT
jgi:hypothetical protein